MATNLEDQLINKVRALPPSKQEEALRLFDSLARQEGTEANGTTVGRKSIWQVVEAVNAELPADTWDSVPTDGSLNLDHYLYGAPKK
jgi:hypothetical protein